MAELNNEFDYCDMIEKTAILATVNTILANTKPQDWTGANRSTALISLPMPEAVDQALEDMTERIMTTGIFQDGVRAILESSLYTFLIMKGIRYIAEDYSEIAKMIRKEISNKIDLDPDQLIDLMNTVSKMLFTTKDNTETKRPEGGRMHGKTN